VDGADRPELGVHLLMTQDRVYNVECRIQRRPGNIVREGLRRVRFSRL
jgi:hypothetical protein